jgi:hypothetical protein
MMATAIGEKAYIDGKGSSSTFEVPATTIPQLRSSSNGGTSATRRPSRSTERTWRRRS